MALSVGMDKQRRAVDCFHNYYTSKGDDRNDPLRNPGVLFQNLAFEKSIVEALRLDNGNRDPGPVLKDIVRPERSGALVPLSGLDDPPVRDRVLLDDLVSRPTRSVQRGQHEVATRVFLVRPGP